jgi:hypothetical protein
MSRKGLGDRPATGRSFVAAMVVACLATLVVIVWTVYSVSEKQRERPSPATFRM